MVGKIAAGILMATAAYRPPEEFKRLTGVDGVHALRDPRTDTTVRSGSGSGGCR